MPVTPFPQQGVLQVVPPAALEAHLAAAGAGAGGGAGAADPATPELAGYIRGQFEIFRNHRNTAAGWSGRLIEAMRTFNGQYSPDKMQEVQKFGGSQIYARLTAQKCRAASSLLRDIYLGSDRPWAIRPPADPDVPDEMMQKIDALLQHEQQMVMQTTGQHAARRMRCSKRRTALHEVGRGGGQEEGGQAGQDVAEDRIEEFLREGMFYHALAEFMVDLPIFPFACIKGPMVKIVPEIKWPPGGGQPTVQQMPEDVLGPGVAVRHLVDARRRRHRQRQRDREVTADPGGAERPARPAGIQPGRGPGGTGGVRPRWALRQLGHHRCRACGT